MAALVIGLCGSAVSSRSAIADELPEPPVGGPDREGDYLRLIHGRIHPNWIDGFIRVSPYEMLGPSNSPRAVEIALTLRWDGTVEAVEVTKSSGSTEFDTGALNTIWMSEPFPPPADVLADDGLAHLRWRFARDHRKCAGGDVVHVEFPFHIALPNLTARGHLGEALRRMGDELEQHGWEGGDFLAPFARQWLARPNLSNDLDTRAAAALALGGDRKQLHHLKSALLAPATAAIAAHALQRLGVDVGVVLSQSLTGDASDTLGPAVVAAVHAEPSILKSCAACLPILESAALDPRQSPASRAQTIGLLSQLERTETIAQVLASAEKDASPTVRGAAVVAGVQPGRVAVIRMSALLHDPLPEMRAAAVTGVLRAGGDSALEQLYLLGRERDPRPLVAAAAALGQMSSEASAAILKKLLKRTDKAVRIAAITALAGRHDAAARALVDPILASARAQASDELAVRELAIPGAQPGELISMVAVDPRMGLSVYRALLRAQKRDDAARWLIAHLEQLPPEDRIAALGDWIEEAPKYAARR